MSKDLIPARARPTRKDVAALAKVSGTTVSRVLGGRADESISAKARERVMEAARELGYSPNQAAKALRVGRSGLIGFWMCLEYSRYRSQVLAEMRGLLAQTEFVLAVTDVDEDYAWHHSIDRALRVPVEGIIAFDATRAAQAFAKDSERLAPNLPFVSMGAFWAEQRSYVAVDLRAGAREAVEHLIQTGRRNIAYVAPRGTWFVNLGDRYDGYRDVVDAAGFEPRTLAISDIPSERVESLIEALTECGSAGNMPDALLCFYDNMAVDAVTALKALGLRAGEDVALVGFNGTEGIEEGPCPISTVRQPIEKMCALAYEYLCAEIEDPRSGPRQTVLKPELIIRASSAR